MALLVRVRVTVSTWVRVGVGAKVGSDLWLSLGRVQDKTSIRRKTKRTKARQEQTRQDKRKNGLGSGLDKGER